MTAFDIVTAVIVIAVIAAMMYADSGPGDAPRYCPECKDITEWHSKRGCERCYVIREGL